MTAPAPSSPELPNRGGSLAKLIRSLPRTLVFAILCAIGCAFAAIIGQFILPKSTPTIVGPTPLRIALVIDVSGSMAAALPEIKAVATQFLHSRNPKDQMSVVSFSDDAKVLAPMTSDLSKLDAAIAQLAVVGGTRTDLGLNTGLAQLDERSSLAGDLSVGKVVVLFTDGAPQSDAIKPGISYAQGARAKGIKVIAVSTAGDTPSLTQMAETVIPASTGNIDLGFKEAEQELAKVNIWQEGAKVQQNASASRPQLITKELPMVLLYGALLALGVSFALIIGQNAIEGLKRQLLSGQDILKAVIGGGLAGILGTFIGVYIFSSGLAGEAVLRVVSWSIVGAILGVNAPFFVPNVPRWRTLLGGMLGGLAAAAAYLSIAQGSQEAGRIIGAAILGLCIGAMIAFVIEINVSEAEIIVHFGSESGKPVALGATPIRLGSSPNANIYLPGAPADGGQIVLLGGKVLYRDPNGGEKPLPSGQRLRFGRIEIEIRTAPKKGK